MVKKVLGWLTDPRAPHYFINFVHVVVIWLELLLQFLRLRDDIWYIILWSLWRICMWYMSLWSIDPHFAEYLVLDIENARLAGWTALTVYSDLIFIDRSSFAYRYCCVCVWGGCITFSSSCSYQQSFSSKGSPDFSWEQTPDTDNVSGTEGQYRGSTSPLFPLWAGIWSISVAFARDVQ